MNPFVRDPTAESVLKCINQILMEEELEDQTFIPRDSALQAAEKSLSDILAEKCSSSTNKAPPTQNLKNQVSTSCCNIYGCNPSMTADKVAASSSIALPFSLQSYSSPPFPLGSFLGTTDELVNSSDVNTALRESQSIAQFKQGIEETSKFHQRENEMILDFANNRTIPMAMAMTKKSRRDNLAWKQRKRKNHELDMRKKKHSAIYNAEEESEQGEMFDKILLSIGADDEIALFNPNEAFEKGPGAVRMLHQKKQSRGSNSGKTRRKSQVNQRELFDMRNLLIHCAEAVAGNDQKSAAELLMQIRQHSTPFGDGSQRLAHCFAFALEARMAGTGSDLYAALGAKKVTATCVSEVCRLFISACPFMSMSNLFATQTIMELTEKAATLHIIHFGILYGFPWPSLIQQLSTRSGGPPVLRITGIEFPQHGYGSAEMLEEIGLHLASYCERFNVPFEYNAISKEWESIRLEELKIERDEVIVVSSLYRFRHLLDETVVLNSQRDAVLNLIKRINPDVFIHGIVNGAYSAPFFISRFREALFYFLSLFDMLEANTSREDPVRMVFEQEIFGKEILNVIACEGSERLERPEKYKQWQVRNGRAGLRQLPLKEEIVKKVKEQVKLCYHQDFLVDEDGQWMLQGWKGRILFAISCWKSA